MSNTVRWKNKIQNLVWRAKAPDVYLKDENAMQILARHDFVQTNQRQQLTNPRGRYDENGRGWAGSDEKQNLLTKRISGRENVYCWPTKRAKFKTSQKKRKQQWYNTFVDLVGGCTCRPVVEQWKTCYRAVSSGRSLVMVGRLLYKGNHFNAVVCHL